MVSRRGERRQGGKSRASKHNPCLASLASFATEIIRPHESVRCGTGEKAECSVYRGSFWMGRQFRPFGLPGQETGNLGECSGRFTNGGDGIELFFGERGNSPLDNHRSLRSAKRG